jgi:uncharacterized protein YbgA (DUF1722 family)
MEKCPLCRSEVKIETDSIAFCSFCDLTVSLNKKTTKVTFLRGAIDHVDAAKSTRELMDYHSFDLLLLLRFCRQERRNHYDLMQTIGKVKHLEQKFEDGFKDAFSQYDYWTKKTRIAESLVKERIGTVPKAVTNELLEHFLVSYQEAQSITSSQKYA